MTPAELADSWARHLVPPPAAGLEVCPVCHSWKGLGFAVCSSCNSTAWVAGAVQRIVPVTLWETGSVAGRLLHQYKDAESPRRQEMAALLYRFLSIHLACLSNGAPFDLVTHVPSKSGRLPHPLGLILDEIFGDRHQTLLTLGPGAAHIARNTTVRDGFTASQAASGRTVLLVEDTFTSGATLQSASVALTSAGATVHTALVMGRKITPEFCSEARSLWDTAVTAGFDWGRCCATEAACRASSPV